MGRATRARVLCILAAVTVLRPDGVPVCQCSAAPPGLLPLLRLRGGEAQPGPELVFPGGGGITKVDHAVAVAIAQRRPLQITRGVHRWYACCVSLSFRWLAAIPVFKLLAKTIAFLVLRSFGSM